ncbi:MAG: SDR family NAD(P)-dependent oxidoreductase [Bryobacteraceae bacterium]
MPKKFTGRRSRLLHSVVGIAGFGAGLATYSLMRRREEIDLRGKVVFITGGSRGLGLQLAREFGTEGCQLVICARDSDELDRARKDLEARGVPCQAITCDVSDRAQVDRTVAETIGRFGRIDVLVNNAGVIQVGPLEEMTIADFETAMGVIFWGTLYTTLAALPHMRQRRQGRIVNITSIGGKVSVPHLVPYSCAKFAAVALSEGLRAELASYGIKVVTIVPGLMRTGSHLNAQFKGAHEREFAWFSVGAASPLVSIGAERAARAIVLSAKRGDAENILSLPANLLARLHGALPELTIPILSLMDRFFLPETPSSPTELKSGEDAKQQLNSRVLNTLNAMGESAAQNLNEAPAHS